jgi:hypothetical protein
MTDLTESVAELRSLIPALAPALTRDNTPGDGRTTMTAGAVVNTDVLAAMLTLAAEIPATRATACHLLGEPCPRRPIATCLRALPRLASRLHDLAQIAAQRRIETDIAHWTKTVKYALGLRTRDTPVGRDCYCPLHDEPARLVSIGAEGFLRDDMTVYWQHAATIWCPHCGATWPETQWAYLGRILETA